MKKIVYIIIMILFLSITSFSQMVKNDSKYDTINLKKIKYSRYLISSITGAFTTTEAFIIFGSYTYKKIEKNNGEYSWMNATKFLQIGIGVSISTGSSIGAALSGYKKSEVFFSTLAINTLILIPSIVNPYFSVLYPAIPVITAVICYKINKKYIEKNDNKLSILPFSYSVKSHKFYGLRFTLII